MARKSRSLARSVPINAHVLDLYARIVEGAFADFAYSLAFSASSLTLSRGEVFRFRFLDM